MPLRFHTAPYKYRGSDRVDITRVGCDRATREGQPAPGDPWAPPAKVFWPAKSTMDLVEMLHARAATLPEGTEARAWLLAEAETICAKANETYADEYTLFLRWSFRQHERAWRTKLGQDDGTFVCFCRRRQPNHADGQYHTCHRHLLAGVMVKCGAVDLGEREVSLGAPQPGPPVNQLVAVHGCRPPPDGSSAAHVAVYKAMVADVFETIPALPRGSIVVTGGARGIDAAAEDAAKGAGFKVIVVQPYYAAWGRGAPNVRNAYNAAAPRCLSWASPWSVGSWDAIQKAKAGAVDLDERWRRFWTPEGYGTD